MSEAGAWAAGLGLLGLVFGSFVATVALRWPQGRSAIAGRSICDGCGRTLAIAELVPLASWAWLRGRCRSCGSGIAPSHPAIELIAGVIGAAAGWVEPGWGGASGAVFGWLLLALAAIDLAAFWLPDRLTLTLAIAGLATAGFGLQPPLVDRLVGGVVGFAALWTVAAAYRRWRGRDGLGGGDAKLFGAIGLWLGWRELAPTMLVASGIGLAIVAGGTLGGRRYAATDRLPLGALLAAAAFALWLVART